MLLEIDSTHAPAQPGEGVFVDGHPAGSITSAGWGYRIQKNLAMAYVVPELANQETRLQVLLFGQPVSARVCASCQFDPENRIPRGLN